MIESAADNVICGHILDHRSNARHRGVPETRLNGGRSVTIQSHQKRDAFVSYASEDREAVARPLAERLEQFGLRVWYDQTELRVGDRLRRKIAEGLKHCRYGVVILSESFFNKHYPTLELDGLAQREQDGKDVILPVWHDVDAEQIRGFDPSLADRVAVKWQDGIHAVVDKLVEVIRPDLHKQFREEVERLAKAKLPRITSAAALTRIIGAADGVLPLHGDLSDGEVDLIGGFLQEIRGWSEIWAEMEPIERAEASVRLGDQLKEIRDCGWSVFARVVQRQAPAGDKPLLWRLAVVVITRGEPQAVIHEHNSAYVVR